MLGLLAVAVLCQTPVVVQDPFTSKKSRVVDCAGGQQCLEVKVVEQPAGGAGLTNAELRASVVPVYVDGGVIACTQATSPWVIGDGAGPVTVDGTVSVTGVAQDSTLTGGTMKAIARGGAKGATAAADVTSTAEGADHQAIDVQLYSGGVAKDPTAIRALTSADVVTIVPPTSGNGTAASSVRVAMASDNSPVSGLGAGATAAAVPANAVYQGVREGANLVGLIQCDKFAQASISTATTTSLIAVSGATTIYVCSYVIEIQGVATTAGTNRLVYGTGAACTGAVNVSPDYIGSTTAGNPTAIAQTAGSGYLFKTTASQGLCSTTTTTTVQKVFVTYAQL